MLETPVVLAGRFSAVDADAVVPAEWAREKLGIPADEDPIRQGLDEMVPGNYPGRNPSQVGNQTVAPMKEDDMADKKLM